MVLPKEARLQACCANVHLSEHFLGYFWRLLDTADVHAALEAILELPKATASRQDLAFYHHLQKETR
jgi:hypothetical protein